MVQRAHHYGLSGQLDLPLPAGEGFGSTRDKKILGETGWGSIIERQVGEARKHPTDHNRIRPLGEIEQWLTTSLPPTHLVIRVPQKTFPGSFTHFSIRFRVRSAMWAG